MKNRWDDSAAQQLGDDVELRAYSSRLLGADSDLVLHGGGNTSVKGAQMDVFGESVPTLYVKGSGWDLASIEAAGFPPTRIDYLLRLAQLDQLSDSDMMTHLRLSLLDPKAPTPSVEAILHALIPCRFVDHSHADAIVTLSNTPDGEQLLSELFGDEVLILPYIMPGFILARQVADATANLDWDKLRGIILMHHGIFTFAEDAKTSYSNMIELVSKAEDLLAQRAPRSSQASAEYTPTAHDAQALAKLRREAGELFGGPCLARLDSSAAATGFACLENAAELLGIGPLTPDHTIHAKAFGAAFDEDPLPGLQAFAERYRTFFSEHANEDHQILDPMPRYGAWKGKGMVYLAANCKRLRIVSDISHHTLRCIQQGEQLGGWTALPTQDLFDVEYWELEQAKLKTSTARPEFDGQVALVSGAASGIGAACVKRLLAGGAAVIALDLDAAAMEPLAADNCLTLGCNITSQREVDAAVMAGVLRFGGIDLLVNNAGMFPASAAVTELTDADWQCSIDVNLTGQMRLLRACLPYLEQGFSPAVVMVGSKNVPAPGPGAAAYSAAKAGMTQLARVVALESGGKDIRVNVLHPNAVYDTGIWTEEVLAERAAHYGLSVAEYKARNLLKTEVASADVAEAVAVFLGRSLAKTTGAQLAVDGGNDRVI